MITKFFLLLVGLLLLAGVGYLVFVEVPVPQQEVQKEITLPMEKPQSTPTE